MDVVTNAFQSERENLNLHYLNYDNFYQSSTKMHWGELRDMTDAS